MFNLQNKLECLRQIKPTTPKCRRSIREATKYNNNNNNMSLSSDLPVKRRNILTLSKECNDEANSDSDSNSTESESFIDDSFQRNSSSKYTSSLKDHSHNESLKTSENSETTSFFSYVLIIIFVTCFLTLFLPHFWSPQNKSNGNERILEFRKLVNDNQLKFKNQNSNIWNAFASQVEEIINELAKTSIIVLLGNETNTVTCLAHLLGHISNQALNNNNYLTLNAKNIGNKQGEIIEKLKAEIQFNRVVIIEDLLTINSEAIKVLHNLCDKENPLVSNTVYIITIISDDYKGTNVDTFVEDNLTAKFSKAINLDILNPLITRIMDGPIIPVLPEPSMTGSKTIKECLLF